MQKKSVSFLVLASAFVFLTSISYVSAAFYSGYGFSFGDLLDSIDPSTMVLGTIFIISFALINLSLTKSIFRHQPGTAGVVAFAASLFIAWGINRTGFDYSSLFYDIFFFIPEDLLYTIIPFIILGLIIYGFVKLGLGETLAILGGFLLVISFTDLVYERGIIFIIGIVFFIFGIVLMFRKKKDNVGSDSKISKTYSSGTRGYANRYSNWNNSRQQTQQKQATIQKKPIKQRNFFQKRQLAKKMRAAAEREDYARSRKAAEKENAYRKDRAAAEREDYARSRKAAEEENAKRKAAKKEAQNVKKAYEKQQEAKNIREFYEKKINVLYKRNYKKKWSNQDKKELKRLQTEMKENLKKLK